VRWQLLALVGNMSEYRPDIDAAVRVVGPMLDEANAEAS
jgi:hypothetical protein